MSGKEMDQFQNSSWAVYKPIAPIKLAPLKTSKNKAPKMFKV